MENNIEEIDLVDVLKPVWKQKKLILLISFFFTLLGIAAALLSPAIYTSSTTFITTNSESAGNSSLSGVASLVGINLGGISNSDNISPTMYPQIGESVEFKRKLLEKHIDEKKEIKLIDFLIEHYKIKQSSLESYNKNNKSFISETENELFDIINNILTIAVNKKDRFITISSSMPNSEYAANTCVNAREILQETVISNRIKSAKQKLQFSEEQLAEKRIEFEEVQNKLAYFNDSNLNIVTSSIISQRDKLEAEFNIINAVMIELSKQVEQRKLQVSEDTPVFSIIKEASMPVNRSSPKRVQMVIVFGFIGFVISFVYVVGKKYLKEMIKEIISWLENLKNLFFS